MQNEKFIFDSSLFSNKDINSVYLTAKDYHSLKGVASQLFRTDAGSPAGPMNTWYVKGPMGMGLKLDRNGLNIAFVAGTGILVLLDIVARIAIYNCGLA